MSFKNNLYEIFCLLINFFMSAIKPSEISIEEFANDNILFVKLLHKSGQ